MYYISNMGMGGRGSKKNQIKDIKCLENISKIKDYTRLY